jgi:hypothetical protein
MVYQQRRVMFPQKREPGGVGAFAVPHRASPRSRVHPAQRMAPSSEPSAGGTIGPSDRGAGGTAGVPGPGASPQP